MKIKSFKIFLLSTLFFSVFINTTVKSQNPEESVMDVNNITSWIKNDGFHPWIVGPSNSSQGWNGRFPKDIPVGVIFSEGLVWGGKVLDSNDPLIRVSGSTYFNGNVPLTRLFRVRTYFKEEDLNDDAANFFRVSSEDVTEPMVTKIYKQYEKDWNEWPAEKGAPFYDKNKNGIYEPDIDIPGVPGSSQTIWIDYNDAESRQSYGSPPIGLEVQETYWAYTYSSIENVIYKQAKLIYKGTDSSNPDSFIDSMYIVQWVDTDLGNFTDDFLGCDTLLNLGYTYNSSSKDGSYSQYLKFPPAAGFIFLQGVAKRTGVQTDSAIVNFKWTHGYKYLHSKPMTIFIAKRTAVGWTDPDGQDSQGTLQFYNLMRGYLPRPPYPSSIPFVTSYGKELDGFGTYNLTGDPVTHTGWVDGIGEPPGDRRMFLITGPFYMGKGDTAEVVVALVGAVGSSNLGNITYLKYNTKYAAFEYDLFVDQMTSGNILLPPHPPPVEKSPGTYFLYQNYPNPFNSSTQIRFEIGDFPQGSSELVTIKVFDVLGREAATIVNEEKSAGKYKVEFDASALPSGVYFYQLKAGNFIQTNKMILVK